MAGDDQVGQDPPAAGVQRLQVGGVAVSFCGGVDPQVGEGHQPL